MSSIPSTRKILIFFCAIALLPAIGSGGTGKLNDSGMGQCFNGTTLGPCDADASGDTAANPRQDGRFGRDAAAAASVLSKTGAGVAGFDFTKIANNGNVLPAGAAMGATTNDWACTRDNVTGLLWAIRDNASAAAWGSADVTTLINSANTEAIGGTGRCNRTGWRLPTERELISIVHHAITSGRHVDTTYFPNVQSSITNRYWSSEQRADNASTPCTTLGTCAWSVDFNTGEAVNDLKTSAYMIILVNDDGAAPPAATMTDNNDGTITDNATGLMWSKCTQGQTYNTGTQVCDTNILNAAYTWQQALGQSVAANAANHLGHSDWRLPNIKELESLVRYSEANPVIDPAFKGSNNGTFTGAGAPLGQYWSSTISAAATGQVWYADFRIGGVFRAGRTAGLLHVRLVRGGPANNGYDAIITITDATVSAVTPTTATLNATADKVGTGYWMVVTAGATVPTASEIVAGTYTPATGTFVASGNGAMPTAGTSYSFSLTGLTADTAYDVYVVVEDGIQTSSERKVSFTTLEEPPPAPVPTGGEITMLLLAVGFVIVVARRQRLLRAE